jgi:hypothetical protein
MVPRFFDTVNAIGGVASHEVEVTALDDVYTSTKDACKAVALFDDGATCFRLCRYGLL